MNLDTPKAGDKPELLLTNRPLRPYPANTGIIRVTQGRLLGWVYVKFMVRNSVTYVISLAFVNLVTPKAGSKLELLSNKMASSLAHKFWTRLEMLVTDERTSLFFLNVGEEDQWRHLWQMI